jgi:hypothetical protein
MSVPRVLARKLILLMLLLGTLLAGATYPQTSQQTTPSPLSLLPKPTSPLQPNQAAMVPPTPPPTQSLSPFNSPQATNTPTPSANFEAPTAIAQLTATPKPPPRMFNTAEELAKELIFTFFVERANGQEEIFLVPLAQVPMMLDEADVSEYEAYKQQLLALGPGDRLVYACASTQMTRVPEQFQCLGRKRITLNVPP